MKTGLHDSPGKAALDCGATRCVAGVAALHDLQTHMVQEKTSMRVNCEERHRDRFGDSKTLTTTGTVYVPWRLGRADVEIAIGVLPNSPMPCCTTLHASLYIWQDHKKNCNDESQCAA